MAEPRRVLEKADIDLIVSIIKGFRKKPTWKGIVAKAQAEGLPFKLRAIQRQPRIKSAYDAKVVEVRERRESRAKRRAEVGLPRSEEEIKDRIEEYEARIADLTRENMHLAEQLHWVRKRCRRGNIEVAEINRPLAFPRKD